MDAADSTAEALAIRGGKILAVGTNREIEALAGPRTEAMDPKGRTALPGLADIHVHLASDAGKARAVEARDFYDPDIRSVRDIQERIRRRAVQNPPDERAAARSGPARSLRAAASEAAQPAKPCTESGFKVYYRHKWTAVMRSAPRVYGLAALFF